MAVVDPAEDIIGLYERHAMAWAQGRIGQPFEVPWFDRFLGLVRPGGCVLDIGCGSGEPLARYVLDAGYDVHGVDSSPSLIALCRASFPDSAWTVADMRQIALDRAFDGLVAWHSAFHLTAQDQHAMFPIYRKHAVAGAPLMFTSGPQGGEVIGRWQGEPLYHASLDAAAYRRLLDDNGFDLVDHVAGDPACGHATVWLARAR